MRRITDESTLEALRVFTDTAEWERSAPPPETRAPAPREVPAASRAETVATHGAAEASGVAAPAVAHFTQALWPRTASTRVMDLLRALGPPRRQHLGLLEAQGPLLASVEKLGLAPAEFAEPVRGRAGNLSPRIDAAAVWLRAAQVELLHVHDAASALVAIPAALRVGCRVVLDRSEPLSSTDPTQRAALRWLTRLAHHVVVDADATARQLEADEDLENRRVSVIRPGFDLEHFEATQRAGLHRPLPLTGEAPVVVHVAPMDDAVRCEELLLEAVGLACQRFPGLRAFFVGDGPRRGALEQRAADLGLAHAVHFLGWRSDVPALLSRASVGVCCPSDAGLPRAVLEAMAAGLPLVVTQAGGNAELIAHGERGWVVPPGEPEALAEGLGKALECPINARRVAGNARAHLARELPVARMVASYEALYQRLSRAA
ncbi:glycosyltransferase family 4 protein [Myxococcaceae bacterium GXIMD 01537]